MKIQSVLISEVKIPKHLQRDLGSLESLQSSILRHEGILHPIGITAEKELVWGYRRLCAYKALKQDRIDARIVSLSDSLRATRDENVERKAYLPSEAAAIGLMIEERERPEAAKRMKSGRKPSAKLAEGSKNGELGETEAKAAESVGMSRTTYQKAKYVAAKAKEDPEMFGDVQEEMDRTGKVDPAYREVQRRINPSKFPHSDRLESWLAKVLGEIELIRDEFGSLKAMVEDSQNWNPKTTKDYILPMLQSLAETISEFHKEIKRHARK